jgi:hypothetical protein
MKTLGLIFSLALFTLGGCANEVGTRCENEGDCSDGTICAHDVLCSDLEDCVGVCSDVCTTDEDCASDARCFSEPGGGRRYCRFFEGG